MHSPLTCIPIVYILYCAAVLIINVALSLAMLASNMEWFLYPLVLNGLQLGTCFFVIKQVGKSQILVVNTLRVLGGRVHTTALSIVRSSSKIIPRNLTGQVKAESTSLPRVHIYFAVF